MKTTMNAGAADRFLARLAKQVREGHGRTGLVAGTIDLVNLDEAADRLSLRVLVAWCAWDRARGRHKEPARARYRAVLRDVMRDIDVNTRGAAFRFDTPHGPLFNFDPLWEAAGQSGPHLSPNNGEDNDEPTWPRSAPATKAVA
jgi:hypothetical protein